MLKQTGESYQSNKYAQALCVSEAKVGKSSFLIASSLGVLPWQKHGGLVSKPEHLHVLSFDSGALSGLGRFLTETCGASKEALKYEVYNFQEDARRVSLSEEEYDYSLFNSVLGSLDEITSRIKPGESHVVVVSSLTGLAEAMERAISGPLGGKRGAGMDQSKWKTFANQLTEIRNNVQSGKWHTLWEAHIYKPKQTGQTATAAEETLQISGKSGYNFGLNVEQVLRIRRQFAMPFAGTKCDQVYLDTRPSLDFIVGGRSFTESLEPKEYDLTLAAKKLGLTVGGWGAKSKPAAPIASAKPAEIKQAIRR